MFFLITGGARSGKSTLAVNIGRSHLGKVIFIATAPNLDDDMSERIKRHQLERPEWETIEEECEILSHLKRGKSGDLLIVDCITLWVSNLLFHGKTEKEIIDAAIETVNTQRSELGAVSNRLNHTVNNLTNVSANLSSAKGRIEDTDYAVETTNLAKNQILQQASTAMLAQANASKQNVLGLLQSG